MSEQRVSDAIPSWRVSELLKADQAWDDSEIEDALRDLLDARAELTVERAACEKAERERDEYQETVARNLTRLHAAFDPPTTPPSDAPYLLTGAVTVVLTQMEKAERELAEAMAALSRLDAAIRPLSECQVTYADEPNGYSCLDMLRDAKDPAKRFTDEWRATLISGATLCNSCRIIAVLNAAKEPKP